MLDFIHWDWVGLVFWLTLFLYFLASDVYRTFRYLDKTDEERIRGGCWVGLIPMFHWILSIYAGYNFVATLMDIIRGA